MLRINGSAPGQTAESVSEKETFWVTEDPALLHRSCVIPQIHTGHRIRLVDLSVFHIIVEKSGIHFILVVVFNGSFLFSVAKNAANKSVLL